MKSGLSSYAAVGAFFVFGLALLYIALTSFSESHRLDRDAIEIRAFFDDLLQLRRGDDVRMAGVRIGSVVTTDLENGQAYATLAIRPEFAIPRDSVATISMAGLLGGNYIAVRPGADFNDVLGSGDAIQTETSFDINRALSEIGEVAGGISRTMEDLGGLFSGEDGNLLADLQSLIAENRESITATLTNFRSVTDQIASGEGTLGRLIFEEDGYRDLMATADRVSRAAAEAEQLLAEARAVVAQVQSGEGSLGRLLYDDTIAAELADTVTNLRQFSELLNSKDSTIGKLLTDDGLYFEVQSVIRKANRTLDSLGDSAPISAVGVAASALF